MMMTSSSLFRSSKKAFSSMPKVTHENAWRNKTGSNIHVREGWEGWAILGLVGGFTLLGLGLNFSPKTNIYTWARQEAEARSNTDGPIVYGESCQNGGGASSSSRPFSSGSSSQKYFFQKAQIGERPNLRSE